jgi:hypothetical protein
MKGMVALSKIISLSDLKRRKLDMNEQKPTIDHPSPVFNLLKANGNKI